jgi:hypothetical protein
MSYSRQAGQYLWSVSPIGRLSGFVESHLYDKPTQTVNTTTTNNKNGDSLGQFPSTDSDATTNGGIFGGLENAFGEAASGINKLGTAASSPVTPLVLGIGAVALIAILVKF